MIAHPFPEFILLDMNARLPDITESVLSGESGNLTSVDQSGIERLYSYVPISSVGWGVIVSRPTAVAFATPRATHRGVLIAMAIFMSVEKHLGEAVLM